MQILPKCKEKYSMLPGKKVRGKSECGRIVYQRLSKIYLYYPIYVSGTNWTKYRRHSAQCISTVNRAGQYHEVRRFYLKWFESYLVEHKFETTDVWNLLQKALRSYRHPWIIALRRPFEYVLTVLRYSDSPWLWESYEQ